MTTPISLHEARRQRLHKELDRVLKELIELDEVPWASLRIDLVACGEPVTVVIQIQGRPRPRV